MSNFQQIDHFAGGFSCSEAWFLHQSGNFLWSHLYTSFHMAHLRYFGRLESFEFLQTNFHHFGCSMPRPGAFDVNIGSAKEEKSYLASNLACYYSFIQKNADFETSIAPLYCSKRQCPPVCRSRFSDLVSRSESSNLRVALKCRRNFEATGCWSLWPRSLCVTYSENDCVAANWTQWYRPASKMSGP